MVWRVWGAGPPVVMLHGGYGSWTHWIRNIPTLAETYTVIAPDLPGLGDSALPPEPYSAESLARILAEGLDRVVASSVAVRLVGFSFGAILGGHLASLRSERIASFTLVGASG